MTQSFRAIKRSPEDILFSQIIRFGLDRCPGCGCRRDLQAAHIFGRGAKSTRWLLTPKPNAVPACASCHSFIDARKDETPIFNEQARAFTDSRNNAFAFIVHRYGYTWDDLAKLYVMAHQPFVGYKREIPKIKAELKAHLEKLKSQVS